MTCANQYCVAGVAEAKQRFDIVDKVLDNKTGPRPASVFADRGQILARLYLAEIELRSQSGSGYQLRALFKLLLEEIEVIRHPLHGLYRQAASIFIACIHLEHIPWYSYIDILASVWLQVKLCAGLSKNSARPTAAVLFQPFQRHCFMSTRPSDRNITFSASKSALRVSASPPPAMEPSAITTRCHGRSSGQKRIAQPTSRAARGAPSIIAIWP